MSHPGSHGHQKENPGTTAGDAYATDSGARKVAKLIKGAYPLGSAGIYHQLDRKAQATRNRQRLESKVGHEQALDSKRIQAESTKTQPLRDAIAKKQERLEQQYEELLGAFAVAARNANTPLTASSLTQEKLDAIVKQKQIAPAWSATPIPGEEDWRFRIYKTLGAASVGLPLAVSVGGIYTFLNSADFRKPSSVEFLVKIVILAFIGVMVKLGATLRAQNLGDVHAAARQGENEVGLWREVKTGVISLTGYWCAISVLEGIALRSFYQEMHRYGKSLPPQPLWVYMIAGGTLTAISLIAAHGHAFTSGLRDLRNALNKRPQNTPIEANAGLADLIEKGSLLLSLKERIGEERKRLEDLDKKCQATPAASKETSELLVEARKVEQAETEKLAELVQRYTKHLTNLPHPITSDPITVAAPPQKIVKKKYYFWWLRWRDSKRDD